MRPGEQTGSCTGPLGYRDGRQWYLSDYVQNRCKGKTAFGPKVHGHHIVMKNKFHVWTNASRQILCKHGIDPYCGCDNLALTRNWCHSEKYAKWVYKQLWQADQGGKNIANVLQKIAPRHHRCDFPDADTDGIVDEVTDELP